MYGDLCLNDSEYIDGTDGLWHPSAEISKQAMYVFMRVRARSSWLATEDSHLNLSLEVLSVQN